MEARDSTPICLLVHGLNGSPYDFDDVAAHLAAVGVRTESILLPGHHTHHREAARFGWDDWLAAVRERFEHLAQRYARVGIIGHSMGGALGMAIAAHDPRVACVATLCAPARLHPGLLPVLHLGRFITPFLPIFREDIRDHRERQSYHQRKPTHWVPLAPMHTLVRALPQLCAELPQVRCPALILAARNDHVVPVRDGYYIYDHIGSRDKQLVILDHSWHVVTRDLERELVNKYLTDFLLRQETLPDDEVAV